MEEKKRIDIYQGKLKYKCPDCERREKEDKIFVKKAEKLVAEMKMLWGFD